MLPLLGTSRSTELSYVNCKSLFSCETYFILTLNIVEKHLHHWITDDKFRSSSYSVFYLTNKTFIKLYNSIHGFPLDLIVCLIQGKHIPFSL